MEAFASHTTALALIRSARVRLSVPIQHQPRGLYLFDLIRLGSVPLPSLVDERAQGALPLRGIPSYIAQDVCSALFRAGVRSRPEDVWLTCAAGLNRKNPGPSHVVAISKVVRDSDICVIDGIACSSPELTYLQLGSILTQSELALVGMELCGIYSESPDGGFNKFKSCPAVTSPDRIAATLEHYKGVEGAWVARRALANVRSFAASPRESQMCVLFSTSPIKGGFGLRSIEANAMIPVDGSARSLVTGQYYLADVMLPWARLVVEYDSGVHDDPSSFARDRRRRNEIELLGYRVLSVSYANLSSEGTASLLEAQVRAMARMKPRKLDRKARLVRRQLLKEIGLLEA